jgi:tellurite resistance protein TerC
MLALDLGIVNRRAHEISFRSALRWSALWIGLALAFGVGVCLWRGPQVGLQFFTGYLIEESLSVDNLFVMLMIFTCFGVPKCYQHKVLFWGILGALVMRAIFIVAGVALIAKFHWVIYVFGGLLVFTGIKMAVQKDKAIEPERNPVLKLLRRLIPVTDDYVDGKFTVVRDGRRWATPLLVVLVLIEATDLMFAVDSVPAVLAISQDPFIVYTSNVFAILGLRSLYFVLAGMMHRFHYLQYGLAVILTFVGTKMLLTAFHIEVPIAVAFGVVLGTLAVSMVVSWRFPPKGVVEPGACLLPETPADNPASADALPTERSA